MSHSATYKPGLHILATFSADASVLSDMEACRNFFNKCITENALTKVGEAYHSFPQSGFTAVIALTESHLSIHTWPEYGRATFDVFLSNFLRDNEEVVRRMYDDTLTYFGRIELTKTELRR